MTSAEKIAYLELALSRQLEWYRKELPEHGEHYVVMAIDYSSFAFPKSSKVDDREDRKRTRRSAEDKARKEVWDRDLCRDRATGKLLKHGGLNRDERGECCHLHGRRVRPEDRETSEGQILLSADNHDLFDGRGGPARLKAFYPETMERASDGRRKILFVFYDREGKELKRRVS